MPESTAPTRRATAVREAVRATRDTLRPVTGGPGASIVLASLRRSVRSDEETSRLPPASRVGRRLGIVLGFLLAFPPGTRASTTEMTILTTPPGATVTLDGRVLGRSPVVAELPSGWFRDRTSPRGEHLEVPLRLVLSLDGHHTREIDLGTAHRSVTGATLSPSDNTFYRLDREVSFELVPLEGGRSPGSEDAAGSRELAELEQLHRRGILTDAELESLVETLREVSPGRAPAKDAGGRSRIERGPPKSALYVFPVSAALLTEESQTISTPGYTMDGTVELERVELTFTKTGFASGALEAVFQVRASYPADVRWEIRLAGKGGLMRDALDHREVFSPVPPEPERRRFRVEWPLATKTARRWFVGEDTRVLLTMIHGLARLDDEGRLQWAEDASGRLVSDPP